MTTPASVSTMRHPTMPLDRTYVVDPTGRIRRLATGSGVTCAVLDAKGRVVEAFADRGWLLLDQAYRDEGRPELYAEAWIDAQTARAGGAEATVPDEKLPAIVLARRAARPKWTPPAAPKRAKRGSK